jgi:superoxide reductase
MAKKEKIYRCEICGNIVEVLHEGAGTLVCCGQDMIELEEKNIDEGLEKHVPQISIEGDTVTVKVGDIPHPMEEKHHIQFIELITDEIRQIKYLKPDEKPEVTFKLPSKYKTILAKEYCNIHGLWISK